MVNIHKFKNLDLPAFRSELSKSNFDRIETITSNPNEMWLLWRTFFLDVLNKHAPIGNIKITTIHYSRSQATCKATRFFKEKISAASFSAN